MRAIKFRAWDAAAQHMRYAATTRMTLDGQLEGARPWVLLQYTGLTDTRGNEIYEGDILREPDGRRYVIVWAPGEARFDLKNTDDHMLRHIKDVHIMDVIGNIYEQPDLLKR
jgi:YopX protein